MDEQNLHLRGGELERYNSIKDYEVTLTRVISPSLV